MRFDFNDFRLRKYSKITKKILALDKEYQQLTDEQLQAKTILFREKLAEGASLESILVEAYATIREADYRILGLKPFENQVLGGVILHYGMVAQMNTGEGKTLTATMPMYLNGLTGPGNFLVTVNGYLANRDAEEIGKVYHWMGLTSAAGVSPDEEELDMQAIYNNDIVYTTNSALGFDYLTDNLVENATDKKLNDLNFALVDEVDSVLLDAAQTPLVISGSPRVQSNLFNSTDRIVKSLQKDKDYEFSEDLTSVWFTKEGIKHLEEYLGITNLVSKRWSDLYRHLVLALQANYTIKRNQDYVVVDDEVLLLDSENGRALTGMKRESGIHQAMEAKEEVPLTEQTRAMASITLQNFFKMFKKLSGMTGTAVTSAREFMDVYNLPVLKVPTHKPNIRIDRPDIVYATMDEKIEATVKLVKKAYEVQRPVLLKTGSLSLSRLYSRVLLKNGIVHNVLNAQSESKEAMIVADAGQAGAITVATSMAGRGTDIKLGPGVKEKGGLLVIGTERMNSRRVDDQLRGRAGRQGDPGESIFLVSLEDKVVIENAPDWVDKYRMRLAQALKEGKRKYGEPLRGRRAKNIVERAQQAADTKAESARKSSVKMDDILRIQREMIYDFRDYVMANGDLGEITQRIWDDFFKLYSSGKGITRDKLSDFIINNLDYNYSDEQFDSKILENPEQVEQYVLKVAKQKWEAQKLILDNEFKQNYLKRLSILKALDVAWIEQVDNLSQLKTVVSSRSTGQHNPIFEYEKEAMNSFRQMRKAFWQNTIKYMLLSDLIVGKNESIRVEFP
ncbi:accessory Sec system translocase SecA2 [Pediococcus acidilactici]|jgi:preprotein translocase subunit SecA|uniref:accessory Sec system translocase SecA2 n=1 Tax=Pediococcus acidilactici TaxID=1254 RepID=UPI00132B12C8|nr:accessory Sec system translocase SecA2 [Pediococcus acidilactici]KAF0359850.1 accessory Sec system translocase SecA2 [Pediococcus acidilactici]KAF0373966.1 accessory Sec system translocase SecA2 [Pediococcus acidilactici]KAF0378688.1 accessory Sec system translocase SecA2 [Pediococcus acidilactici]KAF0405293.1 accessory Sec system translocase SecA2 [Pediococcus acidilactici]KAF0416828.1 accessory Sec system translocase SecA2 [Pediococcus acidilactici]